MIYGLDLLGIAKYPKVALNCFPNGWALGAFSNTFGDARPAVEAIVKSGKCPRVRIQLLWKDSHKFSKRDFPEMQKEAKKWLPLVKKYPKVQWFFSGACEHVMSAKEALAMCEMLQKTMPGCVIVNCILKTSSIVKDKRFINEVHGTKAKPLKGESQFSFDGSPCVDADVETLKKRFIDSMTFFFWDSRFNGKWESSNTTPRPERKGWPDERYLKSIIALAQYPGKTSLPKGWLYKSHAENGGTNDPRAEKPVIIAPIIVPEICLIDSNGVTRARLKYYKPFSGGGHRYYANKYGYEIANELLEVWAGDKQYGVIHPAFRCGYFK